MYMCVSVYLHAYITVRFLCDFPYQNGTISLGHKMVHKRGEKKYTKWSHQPSFPFAYKVLATMDYNIAVN